MIFMMFLNNLTQWINANLDGIFTVEDMKLFLSSPLAGTRDIFVTMLVRCMRVRPCVRLN